MNLDFENMTQPELRIVLDKCEIGFRANLSKPKLAKICIKNADIIKVKLTALEAEEAEKKEKIPEVKEKTKVEKTNAPTKTPGTPEFSIDERIAKCMVRREALLKKSNDVTTEIKALMKEKEGQAVLTLPEMLAISRKENIALSVGKKQLTVEEKRILNKEFARKRANSQAFNGTDGK